MGAKGNSRPSRVKVGFFNYRINWRSEEDWLSSPLNNDMQGMHDAHTGCLHIRVQESVHEQILRETLMHEILHAIWWHQGLRDFSFPRKTDHLGDDQEERIVLAINHGLMGVLQENPKVMKWLSKLR